ncbi:MAG: hypothetical protein U5J96_18045 [Ignavibacteriaceae bacterium]|nr:hypothetical protein [Ignavibacteriaceae bacterium]
MEECIKEIKKEDIKEKNYTLIKIINKSNDWRKEESRMKVDIGRSIVRRKTRNYEENKV